jgi:hypothetical protein
MRVLLLLLLLLLLQRRRRRLSRLLPLALPVRSRALPYSHAALAAAAAAGAACRNPWSLLLARALLLMLLLLLRLLRLLLRLLRAGPAAAAAARSRRRLLQVRRVQGRRGRRRSRSGCGRGAAGRLGRTLRLPCDGHLRIGRGGAGRHHAHAGGALPLRSIRVWNTAPLVPAEACLQPLDMSKPRQAEDTPCERL